MKGATQLDTIFNQVNEEYGQTGQLRHVRLKFASRKFFDEFKHQVQTGRWGEVAFAVRRKNGKVIVIRSGGYPKGIYRIPTGGIDGEEAVSHALFREIQEELGVTVEVDRFLGAIRYDICYEQETLPYVSFVFFMKETGGTILEDATESEIFEFLEADQQMLHHICETMKHHQSSWQDWCRFRFQTTSFVLPYFTSVSGGSQ